MIVKFILPATEAVSPQFRPIKYSLFPPLGLATLAGHLGPEADELILTSDNRHGREPAGHGLEAAIGRVLGFLE